MCNNKRADSFNSMEREVPEGVYDPKTQWS